MDKESPEIVPKNLDGSVINTVHTATTDAAERSAAAEEEKAKRQDYYVDPLEQEAKMKEKLDKIEAEKAEKAAEEEKGETSIDDTLRPDMNVSGYFSTGATAKKAGFMSRPASANVLTLCFVFGVVDAIYSMFYTVMLISSSFGTNWFLGWIYAVIVVLSVFITINSLRSLKAQKDSMKKNALVGLVGSGISIIPLIAWIVHWIVSIF